MAHTELFRRLLRAMRLAQDCEAEGISTEEGLSRRAAAEAEADRSRRDFLGGLGLLAATGALGGVAACAPAADVGAGAGAGDADRPGQVQQGLYNGPPLDIGIVGAGLAGLVCADQLRINGIVAAVYEANFATVYPGAAAYAKKDASGGYVAKMIAWPQNPWSQGSYTCYRPGQFTSIAGNEGKPIGKLYFAGEHCDSFYDQQGFMEGALASGIATAAAIMTTAQKGA
jgi:hypothetical protein